MKNRHKVIGSKLIILALHKGQRFEIVLDAYHLPKLKGFRFNVRPNKDGGTLYVFGSRTVRMNGFVYREEAYLHRLLMGSPVGLVVDHINGNTLDNTDENLRVVTHAQNAQNRTAAATSSTGIRNVYALPTGKFLVQVGHEGKAVYFGTYDTAFEAAQVAADARKKLHTFADPTARNEYSAAVG